MMKENKQQKIKSPIGAYIGYLFQTFLKRPFGYIVAILYIVYLAVILLIVPAALHFDPLFIWTVGGFNMPIFNLFFIAGAAASIAVAVFRTGRDDGFDLNMSSKPFTKGTTVWLKTLVYILIMLIINLITLIIVFLVYPVFGEFDAIKNMTGIELDKYFGLIVSVFVGNLVNMLFFGGISVFISMLGGQVITIIGTVATVFLMSLMNFLYPQILKTSTEVLSDRYDTEILSYSCNTLGQYENSEENASPFNFAAIQCMTNDLGEEEIHYDTKEYWDKAETEAGRKSANFIDIGKQLSSLYTIYGLDDSKLKEASKMVIGVNNTYNYHIDAETHITNPDNIDNKNYPIAIYDMTNSQGKSYPYVRMIGGDMTINTTNWYLLSTLWQVNFDSVAYVSSSEDGMTIGDNLWKAYTTPWNFMSDLYLTSDQKTASEALYNKAYEAWKEEQGKPIPVDFNEIALEAIASDTSGQFFEGQFNELTSQQKHEVVVKNHFYWAVLAQRDQVNEITNWAEEEEYDGVKFPFSTKIVSEWYKEKASPVTSAYHFKNLFNLNIYKNSIHIERLEDGTDTYSRLVTSGMSYAETYSNLYKYSVSPFYNSGTIIAIWTAISIVLFAGSILVYKKTDFK